MKCSHEQPATNEWKILNGIKLDMNIFDNNNFLPFLATNPKKWHNFSFRMPDEYVVYKGYNMPRYTYGIPITNAELFIRHENYIENVWVNSSSDWQSHTDRIVESVDHQAMNEWLTLQTTHRVVGCVRDVSATTAAAAPSFTQYP